jgi:hypothetical protein
MCPTANGMSSCTVGGGHIAINIFQLGITLENTQRNTNTTLRSTKINKRMLAFLTSRFLQIMYPVTTVEIIENTIRALIRNKRNICNTSTLRHGIPKIAH